MPDLAAVIMAAGLGTRMKSATPKHLHPLLGRRLVDWVVAAVEPLGADPLLVEAGEEVAVYKAPDPSEVEGVNTRAELADAAAFLRARVNREHMLAGVTIVDPQTTWIEPGVELEADSTIHPFTVLRGKTRVAAGAEVGPHVVAVDAEIGPNARVGPLCYLMPGTKLAE